MFVHESPGYRNQSPDGSLKHRSAPSNGEESPLSQMIKQYKHSTDTLTLLNYLFGLYKDLDQRPLPKRFNNTSTMFLSEIHIKRLI
jgi:hypothetical protein